MQITLGQLLKTDDGSLTLIHPDHGEAYHSRLGATAEARLLYVTASGILSDFAAGRAVHVLDVGLGLAYNAIQTLTAWAQAPAPGELMLHSLELNSELVDALATGDAPWQSTWSAEQKAWCRQLIGNRAIITHPLMSEKTAIWQVSVGDAAVLALEGPYDYIWQDPFSPEKNPPLWSQHWFSRLHAHAAADAQLLTYSVARSVRDALTTAGWHAQRFPAAPGHKKQWLRATPSAI